MNQVVIIKPKLTENEIIIAGKTTKEYDRGFSLAQIRRVNYSSDDVAKFLKRTFRTPYEKGFRDGLIGVRSNV